MIQPLHDRVLIERIDEPHKGRIIIPEVAKERSFKGKVLAVGPGRKDEQGKRRSMSVKVGDLVCFNSRWDDLSDGYEKKGSDKLHIVQEADIIGVIGA